MQPQLEYINYVSVVRRRSRPPPTATTMTASMMANNSELPHATGSGLKGKSALVICIALIAAMCVQVGKSHSATLMDEFIAEDIEDGKIAAPVIRHSFTEDEIRDHLKKICNNKQVEITSKSHMRSIIYAQYVNEDTCNNRYKPAFNELDPILRTNPTEMCSDQSIELIKKYHLRFIRPHKDINRMPSQFEPMPREVVKGQLYSEPDSYLVRFDEWDNAIMTPIAIRHFFLAFTLQVSYMCKRLLVKNLSIDSKTVLEEDDNALMLMFDEQTPIGALLANTLEHLDFDNVVHIDELDGERDKSAQDSQFHLDKGESLYLKTSAKENSALIEMIEGCKIRFKPLYDQLLMPIIKLSKMGYEYCGPKLTMEEQEQLNGTEVRTWLSVVHVCELFDKVHLVRDDDLNTEQTSESDAASTEKEGLLEPISEKEMEETLESSKEIVFGNPIKYNVSYKIPFGDEIWIKGPKELDLELSRKKGNQNPFGFFGMLRRFASAAKKALSKLDLERFAHYRKNSLWYNGVLNFISSVTNTMSIVATVTTIAAAPAGR